MAKKLSEKKINELIGKKFGRLTVCDFCYRNEGGDYLYRCKCECGNFKIASRHNLIHNSVRSCGCLRQEMSIKQGKIAGKLNRKHEEVCIYCGKAEHYAKGYCKNCYSRLMKTGCLNKKELNSEYTRAKEANKKSRQVEREAKKTTKYNPSTEKGKEFNALYCKGHTLQEIGDMFNITRERVRQILAKN